jgi:hypothetical protein
VKINSGTMDFTWKLPMLRKKVTFHTSPDKTGIKERANEKIIAG